MKKKKKPLWERIAYTAREKFALYALGLIFLIALPFPGSVSNFVGATMLCLGGVVSAWSKVDRRYVYARQQKQRPNDFDGTLDEPSQSQKDAAELELLRREENGLALIALGGHPGCSICLNFSLARVAASGTSVERQSLQRHKCFLSLRPAAGSCPKKHLKKAEPAAGDVFITALNALAAFLLWRRVLEQSRV